jgi:hypothetical protein
VGSWASEDRTDRTSVLGPGVTVTNKESYYWLEGGYFLVSTYRTVFSDEPAQIGINHWYYDLHAGKFQIIFFSNNGRFTEESNRHTREVAEGKLTFVGPGRFQYDLDGEGKIRLNADGSLAVDWWIRDEKGAWERWMRNNFTKAAV